MNDTMNDTEIKIIPLNNNDVRFYIDDDDKNVSFNNNVMVYTYPNYPHYIEHITENEENEENENEENINIVKIIKNKKIFFKKIKTLFKIKPIQ